jgi:hypothetical protein
MLTFEHADYCIDEECLTFHSMTLLKLPAKCVANKQTYGMLGTMNLFVNIFILWRCLFYDSQFLSLCIFKHIDQR